MSKNRGGKHGSDSSSNQSDSGGTGTAAGTGTERNDHSSATTDSGTNAVSRTSNDVGNESNDVANVDNGSIESTNGINESSRGNSSGTTAGTGTRGNNDSSSAGNVREFRTAGKPGRHKKLCTCIKCETRKGRIASINPPDLGGLKTPLSTTPQFDKESLDKLVLASISIAWQGLFNIPMLAGLGEHWPLHPMEAQALTDATNTLINSLEGSQRKAVMAILNKHLPLVTFGSTLMLVTYPRVIKTKEKKKDNVRIFPTQQNNVTPVESSRNTETYRNPTFEQSVGGERTVDDDIRTSAKVQSPELYDLTTS
jgi:hypothetical protein